MKFQIKIVSVNVILAIVFSIILSPKDSPREQLGIICLFGGIVDLIAGLILLLMKDKRIAYGFLLSSAVLIIFISQLGWL